MAQHQLRTAAQQALEAMSSFESGTNGLYEGEFAQEIAALKAALAEPCPCGDRPAAQCPGEWEPGCDLGNNPKYAKRVEMTPKELAASIKRGEKWKVAEPVQERNFCPRCGKRTNDIHTCTPPATLTDEVIAELWHQNGGFHHHFARAIERWLKGNP